MFACFLILGLALLAPVAVRSVPAPGSSCHKLKESVSPPAYWSQGDRAPPSHIVKLRIALAQPRFSHLESHLLEISDPSHSRYGQHLTKAEVDALVAPHRDSVSLVEAWLKGFGLGAEDEELWRSPAGDWISVNVPVSLAEEMLNTVSCFSKSL